MELDLAEGMVRPCKTVTSRKPDCRDWKSTDNVAHTSLCDSPVIHRGVTATLSLSALSAKWRLIRATLKSCCQILKFQ